MGTLKKVEEVATTNVQNEAEPAAGYKLLYGTFKRRNEAILEVQRCAKKGVRGYLTLTGNEYTILIGEYKTKVAAEKTQKKIQEFLIKGKCRIELI